MYISLDGDGRVGDFLRDVYVCASRLLRPRCAIGDWAEPDRVRVRGRPSAGRGVGAGRRLGPAEVGAQPRGVLGFCLVSRRSQPGGASSAPPALLEMSTGERVGRGRDLERPL